MIKDQERRLKEKTGKKNNNNKQVSKPWEDSCPSPNDGWLVRLLGYQDFLKDSLE